MKLHEQSAKRGKKVQRIGRSGKRGSYSGRGQKGQRSRSGHRIRPAERDIILKLPKMRGFRNKPKDEIPAVFNLSALSAKMKKGAEKGGIEVTLASLADAGMVKKGYKGRVKILGGGEIAFAVRIGKGILVSASAKEKIEKAGGNVQ